MLGTCTKLIPMIRDRHVNSACLKLKLNHYYLCRRMNAELEKRTASLVKEAEAVIVRIINT